MSTTRFRDRGDYWTRDYGALDGVDLLIECDVEEWVSGN